MGLSTSIPNSIVQPGVCTSATRPSSPYQGQTIYETDTKRIYAYNGSAWEYVVGGTPLYAARIYGNTTLAAGGSWTVLSSWTGTNYDYNSNIATTGIYTVPLTGMYEVSMHAGFSGNSNPHNITVAVYVNGVIASLGVQVVDTGATAGVALRANVHDILVLNAGDTVRPYVYNGGGNAAAAIGTSTADSHFAVRKV